MLSLFFSGMILPLVVFPGWLGELARATPWAATLQVPIDVWLGRNPGGAGPRSPSSSAGWRRCCCRPARRRARDPEGGDPGWLARCSPGPAQYWMLVRDVDPVGAGLPGVVRADGGHGMTDHRTGLRRGLADVQPHRRRSAGSRWPEMALLYGTASMALGLADLVARRDRAGRPADPDRRGRRLAGPPGAGVRPGRGGRVRAAADRPAAAGRRWCWSSRSRSRPRLDRRQGSSCWPLSMITGTLIFGSIFVLGAAFQFIAIDAAEVANAFTYGGQQLTQYPLTIFGQDGPGGHLRRTAGLRELLPGAVSCWASRPRSGCRPGRPAGAAGRRRDDRAGVAGLAGRSPPLSQYRELSRVSHRADDVSRTFTVSSRTGFRRTRREVRAVDDLSFSVEPGEMVGYIGPNGAGKSTTIKMLTGILVPSGGQHPGGRHRPVGQPAQAGQADRRGLRPAHHAVVGPAAEGLVRRAAEDVRRPASAARGEPGDLRRTARARRPARRTGAPTVARPADARRHRGGAAARPGDRLPGRADDRAGHRQQGASCASSWPGSTRAPDHGRAHHPRPRRHRAAVLAGDGHRPRPADVRRHARPVCARANARPARWWSTWPPPSDPSRSPAPRS